MKYVALLSGGKDSCFNLVHCDKNGHELVAAASLRPEQGKEEIDSYMYQTVGQDAIELVAQALQVPLYRKTITGSAVEQGSEYGPRSSHSGVQGDETEDLYDLLSTVKSNHPDVQGVSVGAILSNYQRVRVEHVCRRLSLTCLSFLWQRNQEELLSEMIESGLEAILIKVAGIGLTEKHLGKTLGELQPTLLKLNALYGSHVCGEGGEYETLTLDCPLFKSRIIIKETENVIHSDNDFATVAFLRVKEAYLKPKDQIKLAIVRVPTLLSETGQHVQEAALEAQAGDQTVLTLPQITPATSFSFPTGTVYRVGQWFGVGNIEVKLPQSSSIEEEVTGCFNLLRERLVSQGMTLSYSANINVYLSSIEDFPRVNAVYASFFGTSPPARACVGVDLPDGVRIRLDCVAVEESKDSEHPIQRQSLHVQGQSYWAPANIGPYSQAIIAGERIFISGQIGMIPSSLALPQPQSLATEMALCTQHVDRIVEVLKNSWEGHSQSVIYWLDDVQNMNTVRKAAAVCEQDKSASKLYAVVKALPKGALVEKQVMFHTGQAWVSDPDDVDGGQEESLLVPVQPIFVQNTIEGEQDIIHWEVSRVEKTSEAFVLLCVKSKTNDHSLQSIFSHPESLNGLHLATASSVRLFHSIYEESVDEQYKTLLQSFPELIPLPTTVVPCRRLATQSEDDWDYVLAIVCS